MLSSNQPRCHLLCCFLVLLIRNAGAWTAASNPSTNLIENASVSTGLPSPADKEVGPQQRQQAIHYGIQRRDVLSNIMTTTTATGAATASGLLSSLLFNPKSVAHAAAPSIIGENSLAQKLSKRDPNVLTNSVFNVPPAAQVYPEFLRGKWDVTYKFGGYLFPSQKISRQRLMGNSQIPGFQKCSIAALSDVGIERDVTYQLNIDEQTGLEDRANTLTTQINANLGYNAVSEVLYNVKQNPNRLSIVFMEYRTKNAERIELFCNARESEYIKENGVFVNSEYIRQVTFGTGSEVGIPRQAVGNYAHFWTWKQNQDDPNLVTGNLLTAVYIDPQDPMFFDEPNKPVAVYSHVLTARRKLV